MNIEIRNGRVIDPKNGVDRNTSLFIADGEVAGLGEAPAGPSQVRWANLAPTGRAAQNAAKVARICSRLRPQK